MFDRQQIFVLVVDFFSGNDFAFVPFRGVGPSVFQIGYRPTHVNDWLEVGQSRCSGAIGISGIDQVNPVIAVFGHGHTVVVFGFAGVVVVSGNHGWHNWIGSGGFLTIAVQILVKNFLKL